MYRALTLEEDLALKDVVVNRRSLPFAWRETLSSEFRAPVPEILVTRGDDEQHFSLSDVADAIGESLTNLLVSRNEPEDQIFSEENRSFVSSIARSVSKALMNEVQRGGQLRLSQNDLYLLIEQALIENDAHDVAKSLVFKRSLESTGEVTLDAEPSEKVAVRLIRRNGNVVPWSESKIEQAVKQAYLTVKEDPKMSSKIARAVTAAVKDGDSAFVHIEDVQNLVEEQLMSTNPKVARHYILYRAERARVREEQEAAAATEDPAQESFVTVTDENGSEFWDGTELKKRIQFGMIGLDLTMDEEEIERELRRSIGAEISREDLKKNIILNSRNLLEKDADMAKFSARILLSYIYEEVLPWDIQTDGIESLRPAHRANFKSYLKHAVAIKRLSPELLEKFDLDRLADALDPSADLDFEYLGVSTMYDRYLQVDKTGEKPRRIETPQYFWMRVAMGLFKEEKKNAEDWVVRLYSLYKGRRFCSSTPTLFNSGTLHSQLSSCYLYKVDDSIESIMIRGIAENAFLSKWAGGLGGSWSSVRGTGSYIQGTNGESQGVIPFLKLHNDQLVAVNQGGKRRGSGCAYLETWHNDIEDFLELRVNTGDERRRTHDMNTANWIPDLFMKRMEARQEWTLFRSNDVADLHDLYGAAFERRYEEYEAKATAGELWSRQVPAIELWKKMLKMIFETGHPWITFKDPCNLRSPQDHVGVIHSSNLCTEITLNTSDEETAVCNLGSVVLDNHITKDGSLDHEMLRETVTVAIRALDNVIDINFYPTDAAKTANSRHRPIGLGVMGLHNSLYKKGIAFDSPQAVEFNDEFMEAIAYYAYGASSELASERGTYQSYKGSKWDRGLLPQDTIEILENERGVEVEVPRGSKMDWRPVRESIANHGMRNSNVLAIAPTATISNIMGTTPCIEPTYMNLFAKSNLGGEFTVLNRQMVLELKKRGLWNQEMVDQIKYFNGDLTNIDSIPAEVKKIYQTAFQVGHEVLIDAAARRQKWIDQSQSVNLFLAEPNMKVLSHMYRRAWRTGLKTTYYLRTLQASDIESSTIDRSKKMAKTPTPEEVKACSIEAMMNGEECEACQ